MTNGHARPADDPPSGSLTPPTVGQPSEPPSTAAMPEDVFPIKAADLTDLLTDAFKQGWQGARLLPLRDEPLGVSFEVTIDRVNERVDIRTTIP